MHTYCDVSVNQAQQGTDCYIVMYLPEVNDDRVFWMIAAGVVDMRLHICDVHPLPAATHQHLNLLLIEHGHPVPSNQLKEAAPEGFAGSLDLVVQPVVSHSVDVLHHVLCCHGFVAAAGHQLYLSTHLTNAGSCTVVSSNSASVCTDGSQVTFG